MTAVDARAHEAGQVPFPTPERDILPLDERDLHRVDRVEGKQAPQPGDEKERCRCDQSDPRQYSFPLRRHGYLSQVVESHDAGLAQP